MARKTVIVDVTTALDTFRIAAICDSEGRKMLVASVPRAAKPASTAICEAAVVFPRPVASVVEIAWSVIKALR